MYLIIFEDGQVNSVRSVDQDTLSDADDGVIDIIDVSNPESPTSYYDGQWSEIELLDED